MTLNITGAWSDLKDTFEGLKGEFKGELKSDPFPTESPYLEIQAQPNRKNWNRFKESYTFSVINRKTNFPVLLFSEFKLPLNPQEITQTEMPAVSMEATQTGTVVSYNGVGYKKLILKGTTGISPFRGLAGAEGTTGRAIAKPDTLKFQSGYEVFSKFRNWLRTYYAFKGNTSEGVFNRDARLVFKNFKDGEFLIIELEVFTMDRSKDRPFMYDYTCEFKVLGHLTFEEPKSLTGFAGGLEDFENGFNKYVGKIDTAKGVFLRLQETLRTIESVYEQVVLEPLRKINLAAKAAVGVVIVASDLGNKIVKETTSALEGLNLLKVMKAELDADKNGTATTPLSSNLKSANDRGLIPDDIDKAVEANGIQVLINTQEALIDVPASSFGEKTQTSLEKEIDEVANLPRSFYEDTVKEMKRIKANCEDAFNIGSSDLDDIFDRTNTASTDASKEITVDEFELLGAFNDAITAINGLIATNTLFKSDFDDQISAITELFDANLGLSSPQSAREIEVPANQDLEQIALNELGNSARWPEISELNNIQYPYIVQDLTNTDLFVKRPGERMLVPAEGPDSFGDIPIGREITKYSAGSILERKLGVDLKVTEDFDLSLTNSNDLDVITGFNNIGQALILKLQYLRGELKTHPELGAGVEVGSKFKTLEIYRDEIIQTLLQDSRVGRVADFNIRREGSALYVEFVVFLKQSTIPIPLVLRI